MWIARLELRRFRCFGDDRFELSERLSCVVGVNSSGKSALLEGISVILGGVLELGFGLENPRPLGTDDRQRGSAGNVEVAAELRIGATAARLRVVMDPEGRQTVQVDDVAGEWFSTLRRASGFARSHLPLVAHHRTGRLWHEEDVASELVGRLAGYRSCLDPSQSFRAMAAWFASEPDRVTVASELVAQLVETSVAGGLALAGGEIAWREGRHQLPLRLVPDGLRSLVFLVLDLCWRHFSLNPHAEDLRGASGVVLVDEIDLHLHPRWQRSAFHGLRVHLPGLQLIVSTHSPFIVNELQPGELLNLSAGEQTVGGSIDDIAELVMGVPVPQTSRRQAALVDAARVYFAALGSGEVVDSDVERRFHDALVPYSEDAAVVALLRLEELAMKREDS